MKDIIQLLPDSIANQIAAGEVVQRPASVVKELMENAIDSGADYIQLIVKDAGKSLIQVIDNGSGMSETDARMSFERHATSKIRKTEDLFSIRTMGFRGEALASIAAVAQVEMRTRRKDDELGTLIKIEGSDIKSHESITCQVGTNLCVKNLFFNVPARRNFLKSNAVEMRHILDEFHRIALSYPEKNFEFFNNDLEIYRLVGGKLSHRIVALFGKHYKEQLTTCDEETPFVKVRGYIGKPEFAKKSRGEQFFFVNNRYIRHNYLHYALMSAYDNLIHEGTFPFYILFIEIDPIHIDINVHPTKTEIKFDDERAIYAVIAAAATMALGINNITPSLDFESNIKISDAMFSQTNKKNYNTDFSNETPREKSNLKNWNKMYQDFQDALLNERDQHNANIIETETAQPQEITFGSKVNSIQKETFESENINDYSKTVLSLYNRYLILQTRGGMLLIDRQLAHERVLYDRFMDRITNHSGTSQQLLFPLAVQFNAADFELLMEMEEEINGLGFILSVIGKHTIAINGIPGDLLNGTEKSILEGLIEQYKWNSNLQIGRQENIARSLAKRSAIKPGLALSEIETYVLIEQLFATSRPNFTPDGKSIFIILSMDKISAMFG